MTFTEYRPATGGLGGGGGGDSYIIGTAMLVGKIRFEAVTRRLYFNKVWWCLAFLFTYFFTHCPIREWSHLAVTDICIGKILAFRPGYAKWDQNSQLLPLSETTSISFTFMWGPPRWRCIRNGLLVCKSTKKCLDLFSCKAFYAENVLDWTQKKLTLSFPIFWFKTQWKNDATRRKRHPQGTHGEAYPCITWCSRLFISSD